MKYIKLIIIVFVVTSIGYLVGNKYVNSSENESAVHPQNKILKTEHEHADGIVMYYFHGNRRCPTCKAIEKYSHTTAITYKQNNKLIWETVNIEAAGNEHFIYDFNITNSGPVIVEYKNNTVHRWKALNKVWQLARNKEAFVNYLNDEMNGFFNE